METILISAKEYTPKIILNPEKGIIEFEGQSFPEDSAGFYQPILNWIEEYIASPYKETTVNIRFSYYNTSSAKKLNELIHLIIKLKDYKPNYPLKINWFYEKDDDDMHISGKDFSKMLNFPFKFIEIKHKTM
jgi:hypothetical protein